MTRTNSRRGFLIGVGAGAFSVVRLGWAAGSEHGRVRPPVPAPDIPLVGHDGVATTLPRLLAERATALQVMFTACTTTCPIQGAIFARVQKLIPDQVARGGRGEPVSVSSATSGRQRKRTGMWTVPTPREV